MKKKVIISACLLGELCRYDGKTKKVNGVDLAFKDYEIIPFCPEAPLFGVPRQRIDVVEIDGEHRIITNQTNEDVTAKLKNQISEFINKNPKVDKIVLKSKSPSCGVSTTPILNRKKEIISYANGVAGDMMLEKYPNIKIDDEIKYEMLNKHFLK